MTATRTEFPTVFCETLNEAFTKAAEAAAYSHGQVTTGLLYTQGTRRFICTSVEGSFLTSLIQPIPHVPQNQQTKYDIAGSRNRPLDAGHKNTIKQYLVTERDYLLPPILLSANQLLQIFAVKTPGKTQVCVFVLPRAQCLCITDGQHRIEALREAIIERSDLADDGVAVSIVEEEGLAKTHQDFWDAAQTKPLPVSMLVEYDGREPVNRVTRELVAMLAIFKDRVNKVTKSIGKKSVLLFTNSMIKNSVVMFAAGYQNEDAAGVYLRANTDIWLQRIAEFFGVFTGHNPQWSMVAQRSPASGQTVDIPALRPQYLHFSGAGLLILGGVGHAIFDLGVPDDATLTDEQLGYVIRLAEEVDWRRTAQLWRRSVITGSGTIAPHASALQAAISDLKAAIGLPLSEVDVRHINDIDAKLAAQREALLASPVSPAA
jgi:DGQHR domain-containing protein